VRGVSGQNGGHTRFPKWACLCNVTTALKVGAQYASWTCVRASPAIVQFDDAQDGLAKSHADFTNVNRAT
jgi:hypothetical protein